MHSSAPNPTSKAFLSHSSLDKSFVEAVALRLGRVQVFFDKWCFEVGDAFIKAIPPALSGTELFVLFASKASLRSFWVQLEINHAELLLASSVLKKAIVFIIDDALSYSDLPKWMQNALVQKYTSPNAVAREIQAQLDKMRGVKQKEYFFGRDQLMHEFSQKLYPAAGSLPPNLLVIAGLSGMGRRTFARRILEDRLSLRAGPIFHLKKGDGLDALHLAVLLDTCPLMPKDSVNKELEAFGRLSVDQKVQEIVRLFSLASENNIAPVILDDGALIESNGAYTSEAKLFLQELRKLPQVLVVFIQSRLPNMPGNSMSALGLCGIKVSPIDSEASRQFLQRRFADNAINALPEQVATLISQLNGYPPAFNMATTYAKEYGLPVLLNNKAVLTSFQQQEFADFLEELHLSNTEWGVLRLLATGMEVPVEGLMAATGQPDTMIIPAVQHLIDLNLILNNSGTLSVTGPLIYSIQAAKGTIPPHEYAFIGKSLKAKFWDTQDALPDYGILEATISTLLKSDEPDLKDFKQFVVPSLLFRNAKYHYQIGGHDHWLNAKRLLDSLLNLEPANIKALALLMKIQVRLRKFDEAESILSKLRKLKAPEIHFLEGFLRWKNRRFSAAIPHFETALRLNQEAIETYHGLATCFFRLGKLDEAKKVIHRGLNGKARHNVLLVDLAAQIAIDRNELAEAEKYVEQLRRLNADADYHHRLATLLNAKHKSKEALTHARKASQNPKARFENKITLINTLIEVGQFPEAEQALDSLDDTYKREDDRQDVRLGLRCKCLLRQEKWLEAEPLWEALSDKASAVHAGLWKEILQQKIADRRTSLADRNIASLELLKLKSVPSLDSIIFTSLAVMDDSVGTDDD
ncbi:MAG TPA: tetratricopeptide repeat protein [Candidatus Angelobacter sp.]|jgi:thioredoxin-like negative regulator of GroEL